MRRFDRSLKVLQDEIFRVTGKVAIDAIDKGQSPAYATRGAMVRNLKEAIKILTEHPRNVHV